MASNSGHTERIAGYNVLAVLGYGAYSTIYAVQYPKDSQVYALKRVVKKSSTDQKFLDQAVNEFHIAREINHPVIRQCFKMLKRPPILTREILLLMELIDGRNLIQQRPPTLAELAKVFLQVADGLGAMHKANYVHADMKPNNVVVTDDGGVKIIDLGQSCRMGTVKPRIQGTPDYIAPEQVKRGPLTAKTDVFNLGATMYWCVTDHHVPTLIPKIEGEIGLRSDMDLKPPDEINPDLPPSLCNLIMHCIKYKPDQRPEGMNEVKSRLELVLHKIDREQLVDPNDSSIGGLPLPEPQPRR